MPQSLSRTRFSTRPFQQSPRRANRPPTRIPDTRSRGRSIALKPRRGRIRAPWPDPWRPRTRCEETSRFGSVAQSQALSVLAQPQCREAGLNSRIPSAGRGASLPTRSNPKRTRSRLLRSLREKLPPAKPSKIDCLGANPQGLIIARRATEVGARESRSRFSVLRVARATK